MTHAILPFLLPHTPFSFSFQALHHLSKCFRRDTEKYSCWGLIDENLWQCALTFHNLVNYSEKNKSALIKTKIVYGCCFANSQKFPFPIYCRLLNAPTVTKIWLRYYLEQLFGEQWRRPSSGSSGRTSRQNSITSSTVRRRSRITYDRDQGGARYYKGTSFSDKSECACEDI